MHGNRIAVAIQEERLLRSKRAELPGAYPSLAVQYCLDHAGIDAGKLDGIVLCAAGPAQSSDENPLLNRQFKTGARQTKVSIISHHLGHAIAVYAMASVKTAAVLIVDGRGSPWEDIPLNERQIVNQRQLDTHFREDRSTPNETISMYTVKDGLFSPLEKHIGSYLSNEEHTSGLIPFASLGDMYGAAGLQIFGSFLDGPGKVMGLAPYGYPEIPVDEFYRVTEDGFDFHGQVRARFRHDERWPARMIEYQNLAASVQKALEVGVLSLVHRLKKSQSEDFLCYSGGVALNSVANEKIVRDGGFRRVFMIPASEDSGTAIGAAFYGLWQLSGFKLSAPQETDSMGRSYSAKEIVSAINCAPGICRIRRGSVIENVCTWLSEGKIVGWFQGGGELGPRALGQRSILCDPRRLETKDILNSRVKFREAFRPFAPTIREEDVRDWFDVTTDCASSPFMLRVASFKPEQARRVPAVVHVDGTGRLQTVNKTFAPKLHELLSVWKRECDVPILLNTSFNIAGEPIVETPQDALWCFAYSDMDYCVLGNHCISKIKGREILLGSSVLLRAQWFQLFDSKNQPNCASADVHLQDAPEWVVSGHISRTEQFERRFATNHLRIVVTTPWGDVVHGLHPSFVKILELVNGERTCQQILDFLNEIRAEQKSYMMDSFWRHLGMLRRLGAIDFSLPTRIR